MTSSNEAAQMPVIEHAEDLSPTPKPLPSLNTDNRLSLPYPLRLPLATFAGFVTGFSLGAAHGGKMAGLRFRAENAHRLPKDTAGWYLYHKSKNYSVMLGSLKEGLWAGGKLAAWVGGFLMVEEAVDRVRGQRDFVSTVVAGWGTSGAWSLWNRFPLAEAARTAKLGLAVGLGFGLLQDALSLLRGRRVGYVEFTKGLPSRWRSLTGKEDKEDE